MTELNQNFVIYQGETKNLIITVRKPDNSSPNLAGSTVMWSARDKMYSKTNIILKQTPDITINDNVITVKLVKVDTQNLLGEYYHECKLIDQNGNQNIVLTGKMEVIMSSLK